MTKLQLSNYIITLEDDKIILANVAATWKTEISVLNPRFMLLQYMINNEPMHKILEAYCYVNYLASDNTFVDSKFLDEFTAAYNGCFERYNASVKEAEKEGKEKKTRTPKIK